MNELSASVIANGDRIDVLSGDVAALSASVVYNGNNINVLSGITSAIDVDVKTISACMIDNELVIAAAFNDVNDRIEELSGTSVDLSNYYTKEEVDAKVASAGTFDPTQYYTKTDIDGLLSAITEVESAQTSFSAMTSLSAKSLGHNVTFALSGETYGSATTNFSGNEVNVTTFKKYVTGNSLSNLALGEFLTILNVSAGGNLSFDTSNLPALPANGVKEAHILINNTGSSSINIAVNTSSTVKVTGYNQTTILAGGIGEVNVLITYDGFAYTLYVIMS